MAQDSRVNKQGCSQCGFVNAAWNGSFKISPRNTDSRSHANTASFNLSQQSSQRCFEGVGGNLSLLDPVEMQHKISELEFKVYKLTDEKNELQEQLLVIEDEKVTLQNQKEDSEKKQTLNKVNIERIRHLGIDLEETKRELTALEDRNFILSTRVHYLEKENQEVTSQRDVAFKENAVILARLESLRTHLHTRKTDFRILEEELKEEIKHLYSKKVEYEIELSNLSSKLNHFEATNEQLLRENEEFKKQSEVWKLGHDDYSSLNAAFGVEDDSPTVVEEVPNEINFTVPFASCKAASNSLHAEISAVLMQNDLLTEKANLRELLKIFMVLQSLRQLVVTESSNNREDGFEEEAPVAAAAVQAEKEKEEEDAIAEAEILLVETNRVSTTSVQEVGIPVTVIQTATTSFSSNHELDAVRDDVVRRINEELAEFREQLKMSQELFHALSNSAQNVNVTQSCPLLAETETAKFVDCSTQTAPVINDTEYSSTFYVTNHCHREIVSDMDGQDGQDLDKLSDDISYRLTINLPTVLEESEQETETSPAAEPRRMTSERRNNRGKLTRGNATQIEDDKAEDDIKSDDYVSAGSSPGSKTGSGYNSLERPLHVSSGALGSCPNNWELDTASMDDGSTTTFGSPMSSPGSPTYCTPSQGSSSQETITNHDGDKTPVNEYGNSAGDIHGLPCSSSSNGFGQHVSSWTLPLDNTQVNFPIGEIPEGQRDIMQAYAYDPVRRASEREAKILKPAEWRTLKMDLDEKNQEIYAKHFAQEEGHDEDGGVTYGDLDEEAEIYLEKFPNLVDELFCSLDNMKEKQINPSDSQLHDISERFRHLAQMYKTEHTLMSQRIELKRTEHYKSRNRLKDICENLKTSIQKCEESSKSQLKSPDESSEVLLSLKDTSQELEMHFSTLSRTARRLGMLDVEMRMYKMIEVMVLYVHILKNLHKNLNKDYENLNKEYENLNKEYKSKLLEPHSNNMNAEKSLGKIHNNNNGTVRSNENDELFEAIERYDDGKPKQLLESLLGHDKPLRKRLVLKEKRSNNNVVVRHVSEWYEVLRRELYWPWSWDQTWKGIKQGFSIILMLVGLFIILKSFFPAVSANECAPLLDLPSVFSKHGSLSYNGRPPI